MQLGAKAAFKAQMQRRLAKKPWIADCSTCMMVFRTHLVPEDLVRVQSYQSSAWRAGGSHLDQDTWRRCAKIMYASAEVSPQRTMKLMLVAQVDFVTSPIKRITATGIETEDGRTQELDVIVCATGGSFARHSQHSFKCSITRLRHVLPVPLPDHRPQRCRHPV